MGLLNRTPAAPKPEPTELDYLEAIRENTEKTSRDIGCLLAIAIASLILSALATLASL